MNREAYFTDSTIAKMARDMLDALIPLRARHADFPFDAKRSALLVLDMQNYFFQEGSHAFVPSAPVILPNLHALIEKFYAWERPVVFTRHINTAADAGMMSRWWKDLLLADAPESAIIPMLDTSKGIQLHKTQYDAFYNTTLDEILRERRAEQVVIAGVMTHLCCETTARSAFVRGFEVFFCVDGTATYNREFHLAALTTLSHGFAVPVMCDEIV